MRAFPLMQLKSNVTLPRNFHSPSAGPRSLSPRRGVIPVSEKNRDEARGYVSELQCVGKIFVDKYSHQKAAVTREGMGQDDDPDITDPWSAPATLSIGVNKLRSQ